LTDKYLKRDVFVMLFKRSNNDGEKHSIVKKGTDKEDIFNVLRIFQFSPISEKFILIIAIVRIRQNFKMLKACKNSILNFLT